MLKTDAYDDAILHLRSVTELEDDDAGFSSLAPFFFTCIIISLVGYGLVVLYSASYDEALRNGLSASYYVGRQLVFALVGFGVYAIMPRIPLGLIRKAIPFFLLLSLALMVITLVTPLGIERLGARRWLQIGPLPSFQPSELLKVSVVLYIAHLFSKDETEGGTSNYRVPVSIAVVTLSAALILLQKDYSTTLVFILIALALLMIGGILLRYMLLFTFGVGVPALIFLFSEPYRIKRLVSFLFPSIDPTGLNWQVHNSLKAIASGSFLGKGLGNGTYKLGVIPEVQSDFIFASLAEELGFAGIMVFFLLFLGFAFLGFRTARRNWNRNEQFIATAAFGITLMIVWQALVNLAVVTSLLPPTGIPLPFFSQGGTNLLMVLGECALLHAFMVVEQKKQVTHG